LYRVLKASVILPLIMVVRNAAVALVAALGVVVSAKEVPVNMQLKAELYDSGVVHERIMTLKHVRTFQTQSCHSSLELQ
jgi:hypothetical protein